MKKEKILSLTKKDFRIQTFKSGGPGGQHQNKTDSGVRIIHRDSGAVAESRSDRSQYRNKRIAFNKVLKTTTFKLWLNRRVFEITGGKTLEQRVDELMKPESIKVEGKDEKGKWEMMSK